VVAAGHDPRRGSEQRRRRRKEIGLPGLPVVAIRAALAARVALWAGALAIDVVADVNDQVGLARGNGLAQPGERPLRLLVAILELASRMILMVVLVLRLGGLEPTAGVAQHRDRAEAWLRQWQGAAFDRGRRGAGRDRGL